MCGELSAKFRVFMQQKISTRHSGTIDWMQKNRLLYLDDCFAVKIKMSSFDVEFLVDCYEFCKKAEKYFQFLVTAQVTLEKF